jgi:hypothetical protein
LAPGGSSRAHLFYSARRICELAIRTLGENPMTDNMRIKYLQGVEGHLLKALDVLDRGERKASDTGADHFIEGSDFRDHITDVLEDVQSKIAELRLGEPVPTVF